MSLVKSVVLGSLVLVSLKVAIALRRGFASLGSCPRGGLYWFHPMLLPALVFAPIFPPRGWLGHFNGRFLLNAKKGSTILSGLWVWYAKPIFWIADPEALKTVTSDRHLFTKDIAAYSMVDIYGKSVVSTEGSEWRRHVAIAGPAFSESNNALVWKETTRLTQEWFSDELDSVPVDASNVLSEPVNVLSKMTQFALHVIAAAGFGMRAPWTAFSDMHQHTLSQAHGEHGLPFHVALHLTLVNLPLRVLVPPFLFGLPFQIPWLSSKLALAKNAFASMKVHMSDIVDSARGEAGTGTRQASNVDGSLEEDTTSADLLRRLVSANDNEKESESSRKRALTDNELFSNIFTFLLAGHETSAHTLTFAILLLALYPDVQKKVREEVRRIWPSDDDVRLSNYRNDFEKFEYTLAVFRETLRCFPTEPRLIKLASNNATLTGRRFRPVGVTVPQSSFDGANTNVQFDRVETEEDRFSVFVPKGSVIVMDIWGVHMNPLVWGPDAHVFRPERFIDTKDYKWPRDGFLAFSSGPRGCIGQRFALTEAICVLANVVRRYEILPILDRSNFDSPDGFARAMLDYSIALTLTPTIEFVKLRRIDKGKAGI